MTLSDPPYEFAPLDSLELVVVAVQLEQGASLTRTIKPIADVIIHKLLLLASELRLHAYAPTCKALSDPPNEFAPFEYPELVAVAMQLVHTASLILTSILIAVVAAHALLLPVVLSLHAYPPTCKTLSDPPYEFTPKLTPIATDLVLQSKQDALRTLTTRPLAFDASHALLLLASELRLHAYAPTCKPLSDPPYDFAPKEYLELVVEAMQLEHGTSLTRTLKPLAVVAAHVLLLLALIL
jgi:hypothetical protein